MMFADCLVASGVIDGSCSQRRQVRDTPRRRPPLLLMAIVVGIEFLTKAEQAELIQRAKPCMVRRPEMSAYNGIKRRLSEALAFAGGEEAGARTHQVEVPAVNGAAIRASTDLSQGAFARSIGVAKDSRRQRS